MGDKLREKDTLQKPQNKVKNTFFVRCLLFNWKVGFIYLYLRTMLLGNIK